MKETLAIFLFCLSCLCLQSQSVFEPLDLFDLEFASNPQFSPDGKSIVFERSFMDIMTDKRLSNLWITDLSGNRQRPLTSGNENHYGHQWSPNGDRLAFISTESGKPQIHIMWMDNGQQVNISNLQKSPSQLKWSPDGKWLAFVMSVDVKSKGFGNMPAKPEGATWAASPKYIDKLIYRSDGRGYLGESYNHIFIIPATGGSARQVTAGEFNHSSPAWSPDSKQIIFHSNQQEDWEYDQQNTEIFSIDINGENVKQLTDRFGPDFAATISSDGKQIAYLGYDNKKMGYHHTRLYVMNLDGTNQVCISCDQDHSFGNVQWDKNNDGLYVQYDEKGNTKIGHLSRSGTLKTVVNNLGGSSIGRPYDGGDYDSYNGTIVFTQSTPTQPTELAIQKSGKRSAAKLSNLNEDVLGHKELGKVEEIWYASSHDGEQIQGWIIKPPHFDPDKSYPLILEIHGGPFANYGDRFTAELQLMASQGYVILYTNPRGSTSYGERFANLIHHNYPSNDYDDLISGVDAVIDKGYIDTDRLFVTGGSGGGVLTSWIIGNTDRFAAAVVAKPVINWYSWALTADISGVVDSWFPGMPWDHQEHYMKRSPISLVGNVTTPTMLLTGEEDYRTPMSESEQYYQALKMQKVPSALVRIQEASHGIASKPSNLLAKVSYILSWFEQWDTE